LPAVTTNEIRARLTPFGHQWKPTTCENADAKLFWARFYYCFGIRAESATIYAQAVQKLNGAIGYIDSFIPGFLIVEHTGTGRSLDIAYKQASDYFVGLTEVAGPRKSLRVILLLSGFTNSLRSVLTSVRPTLCLSTQDGLWPYENRRSTPRLSKCW
jgi:hypothetical protein